MSNQQNCPWCNAPLIVDTYNCGSYSDDDGELNQSADCIEAEYIYKKVLEEREACAKLAEELDFPLIADAIRTRGESEMSNETCPYCGAEMDYENPARVEFKCNSAKYRDGLFVRDFDCYERQLAAQAAEIERLRKALSLIYIYAKDDANSEYCSDTAFDALKEVK
jgi:hypothetical protein